MCLQPDWPVFRKLLGQMGPIFDQKDKRGKIEIFWWNQIHSQSKTLSLKQGCLGGIWGMVWGYLGDVLGVSGASKCNSCNPSDVLGVICVQRWANSVFRTEYEYEYYSVSEIWPNTNTNTIRVQNYGRIRIRILFGFRNLAEYEYEYYSECHFCPNTNTNT